MSPFFDYDGIRTSSLIVMSADTNNDARVTARIPQQVKDTLEQAATLSGATLNQFIVNAALNKAQQVLEAERAIVLSQQDAEKIFALLESPPTPNERLKTAAAKHRAFFDETD